ncbi:DHA2 family efflux MFS transporter permease subunit [Bradyrhizobium sediminis]|uniref:DHA2 family efflux MFS transporter permease subunit n=2 Tax=Bradyrhizobium sediminis TaxID=2840469 RepID=A0A975NUH0_9BRAD|nr:DHA2 family efflux MFS transporter permease subunit [Bradyrhizobium sediminis]
MCLGMFMAILDIQVVATSLPTIQDALAISPDAMSWIQTAYLIAEITAIPLTGWLTRVLTLRWLFVLAIIVFTLTSVGCAFSSTFASLVSFRILQGFSGGTLIPAVFSGIFLLFPARAHPFAGTIAGIMAVLAPTVGPVVGGWITHHYSWPWLFLVNVIPGVIAAIATPFLLPRGRPRLNSLKNFDGFSLALMAMALASLEIGLKQAPQQGWFSAVCFGLFALCAVMTALFSIRTLKAVQPVVELATLRVRPFSVGCALSFCLGVGLFGAVYLMPVFLAYVRQHDALQIGSIMLVTGAAQLVAAPIAGALESRLDPRWLSAFGFGLFAIGLGLSAFESRTADFDEMFWPQVLRGFAAMFCLLPPTRMALETLPHKQVPDASGLFNMMRNLGGAVGIALIDTILYGRMSGHAEAIRQRLIAGDATAARAIGLDRIPPDLSAARSMIEQAALATSVNEAWALLASVALLGLLLIPLAKPPRTDAAAG